MTANPDSDPDQALPHALSIDYECWPQMVTWLLTGEDRDVGGEALERQTDRTLALLDHHGVKATFFVLGITARRWPHLVRRLAAAGHEIGSHGMTHRRLDQLPAEAIDRELRESRALIGDLVGHAPLGFRAPEFSIGRKNLEVLERVADAGYAYDASLFPIVHRRYGVPGWPRRVVPVAGGRLRAVPVGTAEIPLGNTSIRVPIAGGGYWRVLPKEAVIKTLAGLTKEGVSTVLYLHPYQLDDRDPPPLRHLGRAWWRGARFRAAQRIGRDRVFDTLAAVLPRHRWVTVGALAGCVPES